MKNYKVVIELPVRAVDDRAARVAQLEVFTQLRLAMARGIKTSDFEVDPLRFEEFPTRTSVVG